MMHSLARLTETFGARRLGVGNISTVPASSRSVHNRTVLEIEIPFVALLQPFHIAPGLVLDGRSFVHKRRQTGCLFLREEQPVEEALLLREEFGEDAVLY